VRAFFRDHLGSAVYLTGPYKRQVYEPFGKAIIPSTYAQDEFTGKEYHSATDMYYFGARWYDAEAGRFAGVDPLVTQPENPQQLNAYGYVINNPVNFTDPTGMACRVCYLPSDRAGSVLIGGAPKGRITYVYSGVANEGDGWENSDWGNSGSITPTRTVPVPTPDENDAGSMSQSGSLLRPDAFEFSVALGLGLVGGVRVRFSGTGEFEGFSLFGGIGAAARFQGAGAAGGSASKQLPGVSEGNPSRFTFGSIFSASLVPMSPVSPTLGFDTEIGSGEFVNAQGTGGVAIGPLPVLVCAPCVNVNFSRSESLSILRALSVPPERSLMAGDFSGR
jgi:RHS repeat-associated protein